LETKKEKDMARIILTVLFEELKKEKKGTVTKNPKHLKNIYMFL
jgi:hypothetical protein